MKKIVILAFLLGLCVLSLGLTACGDSSYNPNGSNQTKVVGIKLTVYDEDNKVIDTISSVTANEDTKLSFNANKRYIVEVGLVQSGGSAKANILSNAVVWNYNNEVIVVEKCNDNETDTSYFVECKKINETANLDVQVDDFSLGLNVCFEEQNTCGHTDKIATVESFVANAGYCSDDDLVSESLNFDKFSIRLQEHLIIYKFDSPTEFENFKLQYQDRLSFKELTNAVNIVDDSYFADKSLLLVYKFTTDTSLRYDVYGVYVDNGTLCVHIEQNIASDDKNKTKDGWFIALSLDKDSLDDITYFDAVLEE